MDNTIKQLVVIAGPDKGRKFLLTAGQPLPVGRGSYTPTRLTDLRVSRTHCQVEARGDGVTISDCNSALGTFVNNQKISGEQQLHSGDVIKIGDTELRFVAENLADAPTMAGDNLKDVLA